MSPIILKDTFYDSLKNLQIYKGLYGSDWVARTEFPIQILLIFGGRCDRYFEIYG